MAAITCKPYRIARVTFIRALLAGVMVAGTCASVPSLAQDVLPLPEKRFEGNVGRTYKDSARSGLSATGATGRRRSEHGRRDPRRRWFRAVWRLRWRGALAKLDKLAAEGLRFNRFHTAGICSPTRAALLTGRNPHRAGFGNVGELSTGYDGYTGFLPRSTATVAEVLRQHGYATAMFGKNHNTPAWETGPAGPFQHWPTGMGFDYFYGFHGWGTSNWHPVLYENTRPYVLERPPGYHLNPDLANHAIDWARSVKSQDPRQPFFLYFATGATHSPHHAPADWVAKFKGQFDDGWDAYRDRAFARQKSLGVMPPDTLLTPRPANIPAWDSLSPERRAIAARQMEVFAAFGAYTDHEVGRMLDEVRKLPGAENTLVVYLVGDNGASAEGDEQGSLNEIAPTNGLGGALPFTPQVLAELGGPKWDNNYSMGWAWAMNTPFQYYKQIVSHLGATRNPLIVSWPGHIKDKGALRSQFLDVTDIAPTLLAAAGITAPRVVNGVEQKPMDGVSVLPALLDAGTGRIAAHAIFRGVRESRDLSERLVRLRAHQRAGLAAGSIRARPGQGPLGTVRPRA